jgi:hypothetical protein
VQRALETPSACDVNLAVGTEKTAVFETFRGAVVCGVLKRTGSDTKRR